MAERLFLNTWIYQGGNTIISMKFAKMFVQYIKDSISELKKVTWPTKKQTTNYTIVVIALSIGIAIFFGILDYFFSMGIEFII